MVLNWLFDNLLSIQLFDIDIDNLFDPQKNSKRKNTYLVAIKKKKQ